MADRVKNDEMPSEVKVRLWKVWMFSERSE